MFKSLNSIIFILLLLIFVYFIKKHCLVKKLEENYKNLKQGHLLLTPKNPNDNDTFVLLQKKLLSDNHDLLQPSLIPKKKNILVEEKNITTSNLDKYCSNKITIDEKKELIRNQKKKKFCKKEKIVNQRKRLDKLINNYINIRNKINS